jgi:hypothetical protein
MDDCFNEAFNQEGSIAVVVGFSNRLVLIEIATDESNQDNLVFKNLKM